MNDSTLGSIRKLVDGQGQFIFQPGLQLGTPDMLLGAPVYTDPNMAAIATGNWPIVYGNFERGYFARIAGGVRVESSNAPGFANDLESFRFIVRGGGCLVDLNALRKLANA
jgi:HK97 family phage major capsid protein